MEELREKTLAPMEHLFKEGEPSQSVFLVKMGELRVYRNTKNGEVEIARVKSRQLVGEMSFLDRQRRSANVQAIKETIVAKIEFGDYQEYLGMQPSWVRILVDTLIGHIRNSNEKILKLEAKLKNYEK